MMKTCCDRAPSGLIWLTRCWMIESRIPMHHFLPVKRYPFAPLRQSTRLCTLASDGDAPSSQPAATVIWRRTIKNHQGIQSPPQSLSTTSTLINIQNNPQKLYTRNPSPKGIYYRPTTQTGLESVNSRPINAPKRPKSGGMAQFWANADGNHQVNTITTHIMKVVWWPQWINDASTQL